MLIPANARRGMGTTDRLEDISGWSYYARGCHAATALLDHEGGERAGVFF
jgi:hypothetical protein